jgi:hypothetical protein
MRLQPWRGTPRRRRRLLVPRSSRKSAAARLAVAPVQGLPSRASRNPVRAAPSPPHRPRAPDATPPHNKTWLRNNTEFSRIKRRAPLRSKTWLRNNTEFSRIKRRARLHSKAGLRKA